LGATEDEVVVIFQEGGQVVELGDELFDIASVAILHHGLPGISYRYEEPVGGVEVIVLQLAR
jgi:hypothetical protein